MRDPHICHYDSLIDQQADTLQAISAEKLQYVCPEDELLDQRDISADFDERQAGAS